MEKKKILIGLLLGISPLLLAGCGDKKVEEEEKETKKESNTQVLSCIQTETEDGMSIESEVKFTFDKDKKVWLDGSMTFTYVIEDEQVKDVFKELDMCTLFDGEEKETFYKSCKTDTKGNRLSATVDFDLDEFEKQAKEDEVKFKKDMVADDLKKEFENIKYTCTIK